MMVDEPSSMRNQTSASMTQVEEQNALTNERPSINFTEKFNLI